jgi:hypothetical protein
VAAQFNLDVDVGVHAGFSATTLHTNLTTHIAGATGGGASAQASLGEFSNKPLAELDAGLSKPQKGPDFTTGIDWEEPVVREEVLVA